MKCIKCSGELRVKNVYAATPTMTTARRVCTECGAVHVEERILELKTRNGDGAYARAQRARRKSRAASQATGDPAGADG